MSDINYTYNPANIITAGKDRMRFEIGDVDIKHECAISDEEIVAVIAISTSWKQAKFRIVENIYSRFSYEVNIQKSMNSLDVGARAVYWKDLYEKLKKELGSYATPLIDTASTTDATDGGHYFTAGMHDYEVGDDE